MERMNEISAAHLDCLLLLLYLLPIFKNRQQYIMIVHSNPYLYCKLFIVVRCSFVVRVLANIGWLSNVTIESNRIQVPMIIFCLCIVHLRCELSHPNFPNRKLNSKFSIGKRFELQMPNRILISFCSTSHSFLYIVHCVPYTVYSVYTIFKSIILLSFTFIIDSVKLMQSLNVYKCEFSNFIRRFFPFHLHFAVRMSERCLIASWNKIENEAKEIRI